MAVNEYTEAMAKQGSTHLGQVWISSASYRTFVHIFRSKPRGPIYGVNMAPVLHSSQVMSVPSVPTMANLPAYAAVTPPMITPPKRPRFLPPSETPPVEQQDFSQPLEFKLVGMSHTSITYQHESNTMQKQPQGPNGNVATTKRKIEEQVKSPPVSSYPQQVVRPRAPQQQSMRTEKPKKPQAKDQKYFPPGPQKVIRTPIHILKREVFSPPPRTAREKESTSEHPIAELTKLQEVQRKSPPKPVSLNVTASVQEKPLGEVKPILGCETTPKELPVVQESKSDETVSSDNIDLEEMMEGIQEGTASSAGSTKSG